MGAAYLTSVFLWEPLRAFVDLKDVYAQYRNCMHTFVQGNNSKVNFTKIETVWIRLYI